MAMKPTTMAENAMKYAKNGWAVYPLIQGGRIPHKGSSGHLDATSDPEEVKKLLASGLSEKAQSLKGIGYKEMIPVVKGELSLEEGDALIQKNTRHFAKRQLTWYRRMPYIHWVERGPSEEDIWYREIKAYVISYFGGETRWKEK